MTRRAYLYNVELGYSFRADSLDVAYRVMRKMQDAADAELEAHPNSTSDATLTKASVRADDSNFAPRKGDAA